MSYPCTLETVKAIFDKIDREAFDGYFSRLEHKVEIIVSSRMRQTLGYAGWEGKYSWAHQSEVDFDLIKEMNLRHVRQNQMVRFVFPHKFYIKIASTLEWTYESLFSVVGHEMAHSWHQTLHRFEVDHGEDFIAVCNMIQEKTSMLIEASAKADERQSTAKAKSAIKRLVIMAEGKDGTKHIAMANAKFINTYFPGKTICHGKMVVTASMKYDTHYHKVSSMARSRIVFTTVTEADWENVKKEMEEK